MSWITKLTNAPVMDWFLEWIDCNKEGAAIGATWGFLFFLSGNTFGPAYEFLINLLKPASNTQFLLYLVDIGLIIGALIDSLWRKTI